MFALEVPELGSDDNGSEILAKCPVGRRAGAVPADLQQRSLESLLRSGSWMGAWNILLCCNLHADHRIVFEISAKLMFRDRRFHA